MNAMGIEAATMPALSLALDAAVVRQRVIAGNIANAHTEGYAPRDARFEAAFAEVVGASGGDGTSTAGGYELRTRIEPRATLSIDGAVRLDEEVAAMARNGAHYQALLKAMNRHLSVLASAVSDGRR